VREYDEMREGKDRLTLCLIILSVFSETNSGKRRKEGEEKR
jgi:hypothetical protein